MNGKVFSPRKGINLKCVACENVEWIKVAETMAPITGNSKCGQASANHALFKQYKLKKE
jgi:hypothetical protein